ncbi:30S ribosomal protein S16 [Patescibacteria group bacterium]|nr:30S ribosomal protein S16 [Patescibacteria group bacterium]MBU1075019.1 30S ribosomal protein S16 [Patescibacteria group bacterium]MBU1952583.1 30S ribosomal protein S16 [Patescibacteria group bacterium]
MVTIRLTRVGQKNKPQYRIVVQEKSKATASDYLEKVGFYNPHDDSENGLQLNEERIKHWISKGAMPSDTVHNMLVEKGIIEGKKIPKGRPTKKKKEGEVKAEAPKEEKKEEPKAEAKKAEDPEQSQGNDDKKEDPPKAEEKVEKKKEEPRSEDKKEEAPKAESPDQSGGKEIKEEESKPEDKVEEPK